MDTIQIKDKMFTVSIKEHPSAALIVPTVISGKL